MQRIGTLALRAPWKLLGLAIIAWVSCHCAAALSRRQDTITFLHNPELQGRCLERTDLELGTGLFI
jgi:hypothetical protein